MIPRAGICAIIAPRAIPAAIAPRPVPSPRPWGIIASVSVVTQARIVRFLEIDFVIIAVENDINVVCADNRDLRRIMEFDDSLGQFAIDVFDDGIRNFFIHIDIVAGIASIILIHVAVGGQSGQHNGR
jgi:hypothetical protein